MGKKVLIKCCWSRELLTFKDAVQKVELVFGDELSMKRLVRSGNGM